MKTLVSAIALAPLMLGSCATAGKSLRTDAATSSETYFTFNEGANYCYARFLSDAPIDRVCLNGDLVTYGPITNIPPGFRPMPNYVTALFNATKPYTSDQKGNLPSESQDFSSAESRRTN